MSDSDKLKSWSLLSEYEKHRVELVDLAKVAFSSLFLALGVEPTQDECTRALAGALFNTTLFKNMVARKQHMQPVFYAAYARIMARHVLQTNWIDVREPYP